MTRPPTIISRVARKSRLANTNAPSATATTNGIQSFAAAPRPSAPPIVPRSEDGAPSADMSMRKGSSPFARGGANTPFSVMYADSPRKISTISDFMLPAPTRISVLLPQPDASVIPKPNRKPPTRFDSHGTCAVV